MILTGSGRPDRGQWRLARDRLGPVSCGRDGHRTTTRPEPLRRCVDAANARVHGRAGRPGQRRHLHFGPCGSHQVSRRGDPGARPIAVNSCNAALLDFDAPGRQDGHRIDGGINRPAITDVQIISSPLGGMIYGKDETIEVEVTFDTAVRVSGTPALTLSIGREGFVVMHPIPRTAAYLRGDRSTKLVFGYTVTASDQGPCRRCFDTGECPGGRRGPGSGPAGQRNAQDREEQRRQPACPPAERRARGRPRSPGGGDGEPVRRCASCLSGAGRVDPQSDIFSFWNDTSSFWTDKLYRGCGLPADGHHGAGRAVRRAGDGGGNARIRIRFSTGTRWRWPQARTRSRSR